MKFLRKYELIQENGQLTLGKKRVRSVLNLLIDLALIMGWYLGLIVEGLDPSINPLGYLLYIAPILLAPRLFKVLKNLVQPKTYIFDLSINELTINYMESTSISDITRVEIDYPNKYQIETCTLGLVLRNQSTLVIDVYDANSTEVIRTAKKLSSFLGVPVVDRHPFEERL